MAAETPSAARCRRGRRRSRDDSSGGSRRVRALDSRSGSCFAHGLGASHAVLCSRFGLGGSYTRGGASHAALCCRFYSCFAHGFGELYARAACWLVVLLVPWERASCWRPLAALWACHGAAGHRLARGCIIGAPTTLRGAPRNGSKIAERRVHGRRTRPTAHRSASWNVDALSALPACILSGGEADAVYIPGSHEAPFLEGGGQFGYMSRGAQFANSSGVLFFS